MKLLIDDKKRNIYFRKDNTAYYKNGGTETDVTNMFKKTGGGLKKQFSNLLIEGDEKYANTNMLGGKPKKSKSRKSKLVGGVTIKKEFKFAPISVTYNPNFEESNDDSNDQSILDTKLNELKDTHKTLLLLSILKTLKYEPTSEIDDFNKLTDVYSSTKFADLHKSINTILAEITSLEYTNIKTLETKYKELQPLMETLLTKNAADAAAAAADAAAPVAAAVAAVAADAADGVVAAG